MTTTTTTNGTNNEIDSLESALVFFVWVGWLVACKKYINKTTTTTTKL